MIYQTYATENTRGKFIIKHKDLSYINGRILLTVRVIKLKEKQNSAKKGYETISLKSFKTGDPFPWDDSKTQPSRKAGTDMINCRKFSVQQQ